MKPALLIREYTPADREACLALFRGNTPDFFLPDEIADLAAFLDSLPGPYLVAEENGSVVACGGYRLAPPEAVLTWGIVARDRHRQGIGRRLLLARLSLIAEEPAVTRVLVNTSQHSAGFFRRAGFTVTQIEPGAYGPGLHRHRMVLVVKESPPTATGGR